MVTLSSNGKLLADARRQAVEYLRAHPTPISTSDLMQALKEEARIKGLPSSSLEFGASAGTWITRHEAIAAMIWSLRANGELYRRNGTWLMCWHEHVPDEDKHNWWRGSND